MDDFVLLLPSKQDCIKMRDLCEDYLKSTLKLQLSPHKVQIGQAKGGISFLGFQVFQNRLLLRSANYRRMKRKIQKTQTLEKTKSSYLGTLLYCSDFFELYQKLLVDNISLK